MTRKIHNWVDNTGKCVMKAAVFTRTYDQKCRSYFGGSTAHMRMGRFAVIIGGDKCLVAQVYTGSADDGSVKPGSRFWDGHRSDRLRQMEEVIAAITPSHPHFVAIMADIQTEKELLK